MTGRVCLVRQASFYELPLRREAEALHNAGFAVDVICMREDGKVGMEEISGVRLFRLPLGRKKGGFLRYLYDYFSFLLLASWKVSALHFKHRYKVIQVNTMPDFLAFCTLVPRLMGAKVIVFMKEPSPELGATLNYPLPVTAAMRVIERAVLRYAHAALTVTRELKETYVGRGADASKIRVVLNGPDERYFAGIGSPQDAPDPSLFTLVCHGAVEERYGHDTILEAVRLTKDAIPGLRVRIMGTGSYADSLRELIQTLDVGDRVEYLGWISMSEVVRELRRADVGIVAQKSSPYSNLVHTNKMYEYIIMGKPVIASRLRSVESYFDEESLCFFEPADPRSLADAIKDLYHNRSKRRGLVENSRKLYEKYRWEEQSKILLEVYSRLLGKTEISR